MKRQRLISDLDVPTLRSAVIVRRGGGGVLRPPAPSSRYRPHMRTLPGVGDLDDELMPLSLSTRGAAEYSDALLVTPRTATATLRPLVLARSVGGDPRRPKTLIDGAGWCARPTGLFAKLRAFLAGLWQALAAPIS